MNPITTIIAVILTFGICFFVDKGYTKLFRSKKQHKTGLQVRVNKRYASIGLVLCILGILAVFTGFGGETVLLIGGIAYTIGAILYGIGSKKPWFHSVFHAFVVAGSVLQFIAIYGYAL